MKTLRVTIMIIYTYYTAWENNVMYVIICTRMRNMFFKVYACNKNRI